MWRKIALTTIGLVVALAIAGASFQEIARRIDARRFPEPGRLVDVGGYRLLMHCVGTGSPTVVLDAGLGDVLGGWQRVQGEIPKFTRVCSYDRAGYGASDPGPMPRTSDRIATELHALLENAGEKPPYLLVGHSFGGYNVRVFNGRYPDQVSGMVLVDSVQEDQYELLPKAWKQISSRMLARYRSQAKWAPVFIDLGVARIMLMAQGAHGSFLIVQSKSVRARASELEEIQISAEQARRAGNLGDKPLVVLTAAVSSDRTLRGGLSDEDFDAYQKVWVEDIQLRLAGLSKRGKRVIVERSGHDVPSDRPDAIVSAVRDVFDAVHHP